LAKPSEILAQRFAYEPTSGQRQFFGMMDAFLDHDKWNQQAFILKGYAGTGKTTIVSALIQTLPRFNYKAVLLAPTGRAAKVMSNYAGKQAQTIHRKIYRQTTNKHNGSLEFNLNKNTATQTLYIVDEASMIANEAEANNRGLLADLIEYVFLSEDYDLGNKILFIGDTAQLPPVNTPLSPALDQAYLISQFQMGVGQVELTEVMRQEAHSGILYNATQLRQRLIDLQPIAPANQNMSNSAVHFHTKGFPDLYRMTADRLEDGLNYAYRKFGRENTIIITRSNKDAVAYNRYIRMRIFYQEDEVATGDMLMVVRNNYNVLDTESEAGFLANGDFVEILKIKRIQEMYGFRFAQCVLRLIDFPNEPEFEAKIILDALYSDSPALSAIQNKELYDAVCLDYAHIVNNRERQAAIRKNEFLTALQVKFAYALTCHKSQGGQWPAVFLDQGYITEERINAEWIRWLYTGMTRASSELFLMNFNDKFFDN
jgi:ATP-dependent exoDNAse (exonuclease V) alpha subunit